MLFSKQCRGMRNRSNVLRFEQLEIRTLKSVTPIAMMPDASSTEIVAADVQPDFGIAEVSPTSTASSSDALTLLEDRVGPLTMEEYQMLTGGEDVAAMEDDGYGGSEDDGYGGLEDDGYGGSEDDGYGGLAPTTTGIDDIVIEEDGVFTPIDWSVYFDDTEDGSDLTYEEVDNTNSSLAISYGGDSSLDLFLAPDANGTTDITIRATDSDGLWVESTFTVTVTPVDDAPVIADFHAIGAFAECWTFSGIVTDVDDDVEGVEIAFGGNLNGYDISATVEADGTFSVTEELYDLLSGIATTQTVIDNGVVSNLAEFWVVV